MTTGGRGIDAARAQITVPLGRAADRLQPYDLLELVPRIAALKTRALADGIVLMPGHNLDYFGPEEALLRSPKRGGQDHFQGCQAGKFVMGIESNGGIKGCPSLQPMYVGGSVRERALRDIWDHAPALAFTRDRDASALWGSCAACPFAETCLGGRSCTAHALFGRPGNNPFCHYRARALAKEGRRERLVPAAPARGQPFDHGLYTIAEEALDAPEPVVAARDLVRITRRAGNDG